jgi:type IV pilus assembly protein PilX
VRGSAANRQQGAALFVSMMFLILLTLLALSAAQVTGLQEKMVQAYWSDIRAFEGAEERLRIAERTLRADAVTTECPTVDSGSVQPAWVSSVERPTAAAVHTLNLSKGEASRGGGVGGSLEIAAQDASQCAYFLLSASESDARVDADASSWAVVQATFVP